MSCSGDERLRRLKVAPAVHNALLAVLIALVAAGVWQVVTLRGEMSGVTAAIARIEAKP